MENTESFTAIFGGNPAFPFYLNAAVLQTVLYIWCRIRFPLLRDGQFYLIANTEVSSAIFVNNGHVSSHPDVRKGSTFGSTKYE